MQRFKDWGAVFAIDHISGLAARGNQSKARPFGSVFKRNIARATFTLARIDAGGRLLTADKNNFGPQSFHGAEEARQDRAYGRRKGGSRRSRLHSR